MIEINGKKLCENCFSEITAQPCKCCGYSPEQPSDPSVLRQGSILNGKYIVGKVIGKGGFGITYLGYDTSADRKEAIKEFFPFGLALRSGEPTVSVSTSENASVFKKGAERFYEEARLVSRFNGNPNIVGVHEFFYENDTVYFSMEYLEGKTLKSLIENNGPISVEQALFIAQNMSNALMAAHSAAVLHRDISPDNIMLCSNGEVKLIDFGAARQVVAEHSQSFSVILKPGFAPLEQYQKKGNQGTWTDIYSLGASLYYALTGDIPDDPMSRMEEDTTFENNKFSIEQQMWEVITKATKLKIADRYPDVFELRKALNKISYKPAPIFSAATQPAPAVAFRTAMPYSSIHRSADGIAQESQNPQDSQVSQKPQASQDTHTSQDTQPKDTKSQDTQAAKDTHTAVSAQPQREQPKPNKKVIIGAAAGGAVAVVAAAVILAVTLGGKDDVSVKNDSQVISQDSWSSNVVLNTDSDKSEETTPPATTTTTKKTEKPADTTTTKKTTKKPKKTTTPKESSEPEPEESTTPATTTTKATTTTTTTQKTTTTTTTKKTTTTAKKEQTPEEKTSITIAGKSYSVELEKLEITDMGLMNSDLKELKYMKNLETLILSNNNLTSIDFVKDLPNLKSLYVHDNDVSDISVLKSFTNLREFGANNNPISDISVFSGMKKLEKVWMCGTWVRDISVLKGKDLTEIGFNNCPIWGSVSVLENMSNLNIVSLEGCGLMDVKFLANKPNLQYIYLGYNNISDASPLFSCQGIRELYLNNNAIDSNSVETFFGLTVNGYVYVGGNGLTQEEADTIYYYLAGNVQTVYY